MMKRYEFIWKLNTLKVIYTSFFVCVYVCVHFRVEIRIIKIYKLQIFEIKLYMKNWIGTNIFCLK